MKRASFLILSLFIFSTSKIYSQSNDQGQENTKFVGNADAIILLDSGRTEVSADYGLISYQLKQIKILKESGKSFGSIELPISKDDSLISYEFAHYRNRGDKYERKSYSLKDADTKTLKNGDKIITTKIQGVKVNDVVELSYKVKTASLENLNPWYFQTSLPVYKSTFTTKIPSFILYYKFLEGIRKLSDLQRTIITEELNKVPYNFQLETFVMKNVPPYQEEQDVPGEEYFISKIDFHLAEFTIPGRPTQYFLPNSYEDLGYNWASDEFFSQIYYNGSYLNEKVNKIYHPKFTDEKNIQSFYFFIRNNWTTDNSLYDKDLKEVFERKSGNEQQINMLLAKILNQAGFAASMVALSTVDNRPTYPEYPYFSLFNKFIVMVRTVDQTYFLDASDPHLLFNMLSPNSVTNGALVISKANNGLFSLSYLFDDSENAEATIQLSDSNTFKMNYKNTREGYSVYLFDSQYLENYKSYNDYVIETLFNHPQWNNVLHNVEDKFQSNKTIHEDLSFTENLKPSTNGSFILKPIILNDFIENPYPLVERQNPITLYTPISRSGSYKILIPSAYQLIDKPKNVELSLGEEDGSFKYELTQNRNEIMINYELRTDKVIFLPNEYAELSNFFEGISKALQQEIKLKKN